MQKKMRSSGIELLRIIMMLQIIILHIYDHAKVSKTMEAIGQGVLIKGDLFWSFCRAPVNVFILITGFFMISSVFDFGKIKSKVIRVYIPMIFYSVVIAGIFWFTQPFTIAITPEEILKVVMPFFSREWYFLSLYILILVFSPFINIVLNKIDKKQYQILLLLGFILFSVWPTFSTIDPLNHVFSVKKVVELFAGKSFGSFVFMYIIGGYIKRFVTEFKTPKIRFLLVFIGLCLADSLLNIYSGYSAAFGAMNNPLVIIEAVCLFMFFRDMHFTSKVVNIISGTTFGVYTIHENPYVREWLWSIFSFGNKSFYKDGLYLFKFILLAMGVFTVCSIIDFLRQQLFYVTEKGIKRLRHKS